jgi:ABC-2 type transport system permease protein
MRGLWKLTWTEIKLFLREPYSTFFTLAFPLMLLFLFGSIYGNKPTPFFNGHGSVDVLLPCYAALLIGSSGLISMTIYMAVYRERGVLRRLHATPLRPQTVLGAQVLVVFLMCTLGLALLIAAAKIVYGLRFMGNGFSVLGAYVLSCLGL